MVKKIKKTVCFFLMVFFSLIFMPTLTCKAETIFSVSGDGKYHIETLEEWNTFINSIQDGNSFEGSNIILDTDLTIKGKEYTGNIFSGIFDGNGHIITFINDDITNNSALFPVYLRNGTISNLNIILKDCSINAVNHAGMVNGNILVYAGGTRKKPGMINNISIMGNITVIIDPFHANSVDCAGINSVATTIENCLVDIHYELDKSSMNSFLDNTNDYNFDLRLSQYGFQNSYTTNIIYSKCIAIGTYTSTFADMNEKLEQYYGYKDNHSYSSITAFGGYRGELYPCTVENCYYDSEKLSIYLCGTELGKEDSALHSFADESMSKSTEDLKKQETFVDYDFENVWGISEYINDGYPYLQSLVSKDLVALVDQITTLPKESEITKDSKETVEKLKEALAGLSDQEKALISFDALSDKVTKAEETIKAIEEKEKKDSNPQPQEPTTISVKKGTKFAVKGYKYTVTGTTVKNPTVSITGYKNKKLKKITIPVTVAYKGVKFAVTAIGNKAFKGQKKATTATIGTNVTTIGKLAFNGDAKIKKITVKSAVLKKVGAKAFKGIHKKAVIKVPKKQLKAYKKLMKGKGQAKTVKIK